MDYKSKDVRTAGKGRYSLLFSNTKQNCVEIETRPALRAMQNEYFSYNLYAILKVEAGTAASESDNEN